MASLSTRVTSGCYEGQGAITATLIADAPGSPSGGTYSWTVINQSTLVDYGGPVEQGNLVTVPNGVYKVRISARYSNESTASSILHTVNVACTTGIPAPKTLKVNWTEPNPIPAYGYEVRYRVKNSTDPYTGVFVTAPPYSVVVASGYLYEGVVIARCSDTESSTSVAFSL